MELDNHTTKKTYIQLLEDILKMKLNVLVQLTDATQRQESIIFSDAFDEEQFLQTIEQKNEQLKTLSKLDVGFEQLYESIKEEIANSKEKYVTEINAMKEQITEITDLSVKLQALEKRNKSNLDVLLAKKRKDIKQSRINNQTVTNYYKSMASQHETQSFFYDKKK